VQSLKIQIFTAVPGDTYRMAVESFYEAAESAGGGGEEGGSGDGGDPNKRVRGSLTLRAQLLTSRAAAAKPGTPRSTPPLVSRSWVAADRRLTREPTHCAANAALDLSSKTNRELVELLRHRVRSVLSDECGLRLRPTLTRPLTRV
jgi:hypothetical protein